MKNYKKWHEEHVPYYSGNFIVPGNRKLPRSTMIFNLSSAKNCPARKLGLCTIKPRCYADHNEVRWPCVMKKRLAVEKWLESATIEDIEGMFDAYISDYNYEN